MYAVYVSSGGVSGTQTSSQTAADVLLSVGLTLAVTIIIISVAVLISCKKRSSKVKGEETGNTHRATMMTFPTANSERNVLFVGLLLNVNTILKKKKSLTVYTLWYFSDPFVEILHTTITDVSVKLFYSHHYINLHHPLHPEPMLSGVMCLPDLNLIGPLC